MTILVTGGNGFIGSNFIYEWCESTDEEIINVDSLTYSSSDYIEEIKNIITNNTNEKLSLIIEKSNNKSKDRSDDNDLKLNCLIEKNNNFNIIGNKSKINSLCIFFLIMGTHIV